MWSVCLWVHIEAFSPFPLWHTHMDISKTYANFFILSLNEKKKKKKRLVFYTECGCLFYANNGIFNFAVVNSFAGMERTGDIWSEWFIKMIVWCDLNAISLQMIMKKSEQHHLMIASSNPVAYSSYYETQFVFYKFFHVFYFSLFFFCRQFKWWHKPHFIRWLFEISPCWQVDKWIFDCCYFCCCV